MPARQLAHGFCVERSDTRHNVLRCMQVLRYINGYSDTSTAPHGATNTTRAGTLLDLILERLYLCPTLPLHACGKNRNPSLPSFAAKIWCFRLKGPMGIKSHVDYTWRLRVVCEGEAAFVSSDGMKTSASGTAQLAHLSAFGSCWHT